MIPGHLHSYTSSTPSTSSNKRTIPSFVGCLLTFCPKLANCDTLQLLFGSGGNSLYSPLPSSSRDPLATSGHAPRPLTPTLLSHHSRKLQRIAACVLSQCAVLPCSDAVAIDKLSIFVPCTSSSTLCLPVPANLDISDAGDALRPTASASSSLT